MILKLIFRDKKNAFLFYTNMTIKLILFPCKNEGLEIVVY